MGLTVNNNRIYFEDSPPPKSNTQRFEKPVLTFKLSYNGVFFCNNFLYIYPPTVNVKVAIKHKLLQTLHFGKEFKSGSYPHKNCADKNNSDTTFSAHPIILMNT